MKNLNDVPSSRTPRGFTIMELMVVIFIVSILAAVAIPLVSKYLRKSKTTEATLNLRKIYDGEVSYFNEDKTLPGGTLASKGFVSNNPTPDPAGLGPSKQLGAFESQSWPAIKFSPDGPVLFSYSTIAGGVSTNASFTARAVGDMDGDTFTSLFERVASVNSISGEVQGGGAIFELDPLE